LGINFHWPFTPTVSSPQSLLSHSMILSCHVVVVTSSGSSLSSLFDLSVYS
jgi:hypothetical protein